MRALDRKLVRGLWRLRGQVVAVSMIVASGVGVLVMGLSALQALEETTAAYYDRYRFADVFASAVRAPESLARRIAEIPGVSGVDTRVDGAASLDIAGFAEPVTARLVSLPERGEPALNRIALRAGRSVAPDAPDEVVLNEPFAEAHGLTPGSRLHAIIDGKRRALDVVGIALSPEFVYALGPGSLTPDDRRYGILWMGREALAASHDLDGAFNFVSLSLLGGTDPDAVVERLDRLLDPYGGVGAIARENQLSNWFLMDQLGQLATFSTVLPTIFLGVAAFLINMVLARLIAVERSEIGLLKSFGYADLQVAWHYAKLVIAMSLVGIVLGWIVGASLGRYNTATNAEFFHFPLMIFRPNPSIFVIAALVSLAAALSGALGAVRAAVRLPPAEAMRPPSPPRYGGGAISRSRLVRVLDQPSRIIVRQLSRRPGRAALTSVGIAFSVAITIMALQWLDAIDHMLEVYFFDGQRQDVVIGLNEPQGAGVLHDALHLPGVLAAEPLRWVGADFHHGTRSHRGAIQGVLPESRLQPVHDVSGRDLEVPPGGVILGTELAEKLGVGVGDAVRIELREGRQPTLDVAVVELVETYIDLPAWMHLDTLNRALGEGPRTEYLSLVVDERETNALFEALKRTPRVTTVMLREAAVANFEDTMARTVVIFVAFFSVFAVALGFGVVYNSARVTLSERGRELASLRVLGFSRAAISYILLGELGVLILVALPIGCLLGWCIVWLIITTAFESEMFRMPLIIDPSSYALAMLLTLAATGFSALLVRRRLDRLDLIGVLKTRE